MQTWRVQTCDGCHKYPRLLNLCLHSKGPTAYEGTEYADITEFRKGDASPKTDSTDPEVQAQGANKYGIGENNNETAFYVVAKCVLYY